MGLLYTMRMKVHALKTATQEIAPTATPFIIALASTFFLAQSTGSVDGSDVFRRQN
jgi:hypothetical protein